MKNCNHCSDEFKPGKNHPYTKFCGPDCRSKSRAKKIGTTSNCKVCKTDFTYDQKGQKQHYCSDDCRKHKKKLNMYGPGYLEHKDKTNCEVCGKSEGLCIDHNHKTGKVRGVLCHHCNRAEGLLGTTENIENLLKYLKEKNSE